MGPKTVFFSKQKVSMTDQYNTPYLQSQQLRGWLTWSVRNTKHKTHREDCVAFYPVLEMEKEESPNPGNSSPSAHTQHTQHSTLMPKPRSRRGWADSMRFHNVIDFSFNNPWNSQHVKKQDVHVHADATGGLSSKPQILVSNFLWPRFVASARSFKHSMQRTMFE